MPVCPSCFCLPILQITVYQRGLNAIDTACLFNANTDTEPNKAQSSFVASPTIPFRKDITDKDVSGKGAEFGPNGNEFNRKNTCARGEFFVEHSGRKGLHFHTLVEDMCTTTFSTVLKTRQKFQKASFSRSSSLQCRRKSSAKRYGQVDVSFRPPTWLKGNKNHLHI